MTSLNYDDKMSVGVVSNVIVSTKNLKSRKQIQNVLSVNSNDCTVFLHDCLVAISHIYYTLLL